MDIKEQWQSGHPCYQFHSPLQVLFLLFDTTAQHPQHCWQEESPCRSSQALLKEQLLMDHRKCCSVWNFHSLGLWWNEWPLKKVSCPSVVISALCSHSGCVKKKNEVPVLATTIIWWGFFFTWNKYRANFSSFFWHVLPCQIPVIVWNHRKHWLCFREQAQCFRCFDVIRKILVDVTRKILQILKILEVLMIYNTCWNLIM